MYKGLIALALLASSSMASAVTRTITFDTVGDASFVTPLTTIYTIKATGGAGGFAIAGGAVDPFDYVYGGAGAVIGGDFTFGANDRLYFTVGDIGGFGGDPDGGTVSGGAGGGGASTVYEANAGFLLMAAGGGGAGSGSRLGLAAGGDAGLGLAGSGTGAGGQAGASGSVGGGGGGGSGINSDGHSGGYYGGGGGVGESGGAASRGSPPHGNYAGGSTGGAGGFGGGGGGGAYGEGGGGGGYTGGQGGDYVTSNYIYAGTGGRGGISYNASAAPIVASLAEIYRSGSIVISYDDGTAPPSAVPEPAAWAMMLVGFGAIGGVVRSRRKPVARFS